jgi:hypothetical protein
VLELAEWAELVVRAMEPGLEWEVAELEARERVLGLALAEKPAQDADYVHFLRSD